MEMTTQGMSMSHGSGGGMMMYFHANSIAHVLFEPFYVTTDGGMIGACIGVFIMAVLYEGLKAFREWLFHRLSKNKVADLGSKEALAAGSNAGAMILSVGHVVQTLMHVVQVLISFFLMLIFMTYNAWLCIAVVLGAGVGYFIFGWFRAGNTKMTSNDRQDHCN